MPTEPEKTTTSLSDYYDRLARHDWSYSMSEDQRKWRDGNNERAALVGMSNHSIEHKKLYDEYRAYALGEGPQPQKPMVKAFRTGESDASS